MCYLAEKPTDDFKPQALKIVTAEFLVSGFRFPVSSF